MSKNWVSLLLQVVRAPDEVPFKVWRHVRSSVNLRLREQRARRMQIRDAVTFLYRRLPENVRLDISCSDSSTASIELPVRMCNYLAALLTQRLWLSQQEMQEIRRYVMTNLPDAVQRTLRMADCVCQGILPVWGDKETPVGMPIPWYRDPVSGKDWPLLYWERVRRSPVGDVDAVWELGRHLFLPSLGRAFLYTGEEKYRKAYFDIVDDWIAATPYGFGVHWCSPLEGTTRIISWLSSLMPLLPLPEQYARSFCAQIARLCQETEHIFDHLSTDWECPNNHLIGECVGVLIMSSLLPELLGNTIDYERVENILVRELLRQVDTEGLHRELCPFYHQFVLHLLTYLQIVYSRLGKPIPDVIEHTAQRLCAAAKVLMSPSGYMPFYIGDRVTGEMERYFVPEVSAKELVFTLENLSNKKSNWDCWTEFVVWHVGISLKKEWENKLSAAAAGNFSRVMKESGWCISRSGKEPDDWWLLFKAGVMGYGHAGHGHADALSVCTRIGEQLILADPGTFTYSGPREWRSYFRSTAAHNTVRVDGKDQAVSQDVFGWDRRVDATLMGTVIGDGYDVFAAYHDAYAPIRHTRFVIAIHERFWLIVDYLLTDGSQRSWELLWHLAPCQSVSRNDTRVMICFDTLYAILDVKSSCPSSQELFIGSTDPIWGWFSPNYYVKVPSPTVVYRGKTSESLWIASLIAPGKNPVDVEWEWVDNTAHIRLDNEEYIISIVEVRPETYLVRGDCRQRNLFVTRMGGGKGCDVS
ncbi:MAG: alginate lyase family protein [Candidatus Caldarchaeum sp.]